MPTGEHVRLTELPPSLGLCRYVAKPLDDCLFHPVRLAGGRLLGRHGRRIVRLVVSRRARDDLRSAWRRSRKGTPELPTGEIHRVLVVCRGNICRSPFASALLASLRPGVTVRSAGLESGAGAHAHPMALRTAAAYDIDLSGHAARRIVPEDIAWADLILAMEGHQAARLGRRWSGARAKTRELGHFLPEPPYAIADPWGRGEDVFASCFERIEIALRRLSEQMGTREVA